MTSLSSTLPGWSEKIINQMNRAAIHPDALARGMTIDDVKKGDAATCIVHVGVIYWCAKCDAPPQIEVQRIVDDVERAAAEAWFMRALQQQAFSSHDTIARRMDAMMGGRLTNTGPEDATAADVARGEGAVARSVSCGRCGTSLHDMMKAQGVVNREGPITNGTAARVLSVVMESAFGDIRLARGPATVVDVERERRGGISRVHVKLEWPEGMTYVDDEPIPYIENYSVRRPLQSLHRGGPANVRNYERCTLLIGAREQRDPVFTEARQKYDARNGLFD